MVTLPNDQRRLFLTSGVSRQALHGTRSAQRGEQSLDPLSQAFLFSRRPDTLGSSSFPLLAQTRVPAKSVVTRMSTDSDDRHPSMEYVPTPRGLSQQHRHSAVVCVVLPLLKPLL